MTYLSFGELKLTGQFHALWSGEISLRVEALLQTVELRVGEDGTRLASATVLARSVVLVEAGQREAYQ